MKMSEKEFRVLSEFIGTEFGIKMPPAKKNLLESRLQKRLMDLGFTTYAEYCDFLFSPDGMASELVHVADAVTTNKTDFFREPEHFKHLIGAALPNLAANSGAGIRRPLLVWSAGCSTGEEPYTIAMALSEFSVSYPGLGFDYTIIGTDISSRVLNIARKGIYSEDRVDTVPEGLKRKHLLRSKDRSKGLVRIKSELRTHVKFRRLNLMEDEFGFREPFDIIFCRNVIIYFDRQTQEKLIGKFASRLKSGGYLFLGHSESMSGMDISLSKLAPSVYRKKW